jgi:ketosteroid isomerase-like protein
MLTLFALPLQVAAQKTDPESVLRGIYDALNAGDVDRALTFVAENAVAVLTPPPPGSTGVTMGKDKFRERYIQYVANHEYQELSDLEVRGDEVTCSATISADEFRTLGLVSLNFTGYAIVRDGLLRTYTWTITRESLARLESAVVLETNKLLAKRYMEELWNEGKLELADELLSEDFVSYVFPAGGREAIKAAVPGFHKDFPNGYLVIDELIVTVDKIVIRGSIVANAPPKGTEPERIEPHLLVMSVKDGKITERWIGFVPAEEK